jgi:hypothetical protein
MLFSDDDGMAVSPLSSASSVVVASYMGLTSEQLYHIQSEEQPVPGEEAFASRALGLERSLCRLPEPNK